MLSVILSRGTLQLFAVEQHSIYRLLQLLRSEKTGAEKFDKNFTATLFRLTISRLRTYIMNEFRTDIKLRRSLLYSLSILHCATHTTRKYRQRSSQKTAIAVRNHILSNIKESEVDNILGLAEKFLILPETLTRAFKNLTGMAILPFIRQEQMCKAIDYLNSGEVSIGKIAENLGFSDTPWFSNEFKKTIGISPFEMKKKLQGLKSKDCQQEL